MLGQSGDGLHRLSFLETGNTIVLTCLLAIPNNQSLWGVNRNDSWHIQ